jgi:hypothetical protein
VENYEERRKRHDALAEMEPLHEHERSLLTEFRNLGVHVGDVGRGEMLFPCRVDGRQAFFIWIEGEPTPSRWRFRGDTGARTIPDQWFTMSRADSQR